MNINLLRLLIPASLAVLISVEAQAITLVKGDTDEEVHFAVQRSSAVKKGVDKKTGSFEFLDRSNPNPRYDELGTLLSTSNKRKVSIFEILQEVQSQPFRDDSWLKFVISFGKEKGWRECSIPDEDGKNQRWINVRYMTVDDLEKLDDGVLDVCGNQGKFTYIL